MPGIETRMGINFEGLHGPEDEVDEDSAFRPNEELLAEILKTTKQLIKDGKSQVEAAAIASRQVLGEDDLKLVDQYIRATNSEIFSSRYGRSGRRQLAGARRAELINRSPGSTLKRGR